MYRMEITTRRGDNKVIYRPRTVLQGQKINIFSDIKLAHKWLNFRG